MNETKYLPVFISFFITAIVIFFVVKQPSISDNTPSIDKDSEQLPAINIDNLSNNNIQGEQQVNNQQPPAQQPNQQQLPPNPPTNPVPPIAPTQPEMTIDSTLSYTATLSTTEGDIIIELNATSTPITVNNFVHLSRSGLYDNTVFHRVIDGFMIQGGDPNGDGTGGPGYKFDDESIEGEYSRGTVAMANSGPDTNGSQFFIIHQDYPLPPNYVIFGKVTEGMEVVDTIATAPTTNSSGENSKPINPTTVTSVSITEE